MHHHGVYCVEEEPLAAQTSSPPPPPRHVPVAICGYSYRLPGGIETDDAFWELLESRGVVQVHAGDRYGNGNVPYDRGVRYCSRIASPYEGLILHGKELEFDCAAFGMSPAEAKRMDPQMKMMLDVTWEALDHAGFDMTALHNSNTGVYIGSQTSAIAGWRTSFNTGPYDVPGRSMSMIANRISFHFNWMGPSFGVATACSSAVTALDAAIKGLDGGDCDVAAFGAVTYLGSVLISIGFQNMGIISDTGSSRSFDKDANGYMRSEGAFMFLLKRLHDAERDGDKIYGVVRGCGLNTAGAELDADVLTQGRMIVAPVGHAQQELMEAVARNANIDPADVDYLEAHATGTPVGDGIEGRAIAAAYGSPDRVVPLRVASSRSNMGHMEASSFALSLLKVLVMFQKKIFAPISKHFKECNPEIPFTERRLTVLTEPEPFPDREEPVIVGINSFGFGGSNGHALVEEYKGASDSDWSILPNSGSGRDYEQGKHWMVPFSAKNEEMLIENIRRFAAGLDTLKERTDLYTLVGNLSTRTTQHRVRTAFAAQSMADLQDQLTKFVESGDEGKLESDAITKVSLLSAASVLGNNTATGSHTSDLGTPVAPSTVLMIFPGQGSQWAGCGKELYETELVFRRVVDAIDDAWIQLSGDGTKLSDLAFNKDIAADLLNQVQVAQPVTFLLQVAMFELLKSYGVHPDAVMGHSAGETAAAYASGAYTLDEACYLCYHRSQLQAKLSGSGRMLVLMMGKDETVEAIEKAGISCGGDSKVDCDVVDVACYNAPGNTVVCGPADVIARLQVKLQEQGLPEGKLIPGSIAFHSRWVEPIKQEMMDTTSVVGEKTPLVPIISPATGTIVPKLNADFWWINTRNPVNFVAGMNVVIDHLTPDAIIELSPHITLRSPIRECYAAKEIAFPPYIHSLVRNCNAAQGFAGLIGRCFKAGNLLALDQIYPRPRPITDLFPRCWMKREKMVDDLLDEHALRQKEGFHAGPILAKSVPGQNTRYQNMFSKRHFPWMMDHRVQGQSLIPAAVYVECILEAFGGEPLHFPSIRFLAPFALTDEERILYTDIFPNPHMPGQFDFKITSRSGSAEDVPSTLHSFGTVRKIVDDKMISLVLPPDLPRTKGEWKFNADLPIVTRPGEMYEIVEARIGEEEYNYGPYFQVITKMDKDAKTMGLRVEIECNEELWNSWDKMGYIMQPTMLDGSLQIFMATIIELTDYSGIPIQIRDLVFLKKPSCHKITCFYEPPQYLREGQMQKGQPTLGLGERPAGTVSFYDGQTDELIAYIKNYDSFTSNTKSSNLKRTRHFLSWQPKDACSQPDILVPSLASLSAGHDAAAVFRKLVDDAIAKGHPDQDTPFFVNAAEVLLGTPPESLILERNVDSYIDAPVQYTIIAPEKETEYIVSMYQKITTAKKDAHLRFFTIPETFDEGFLRPGMFEVVMVRVAGDLSEGMELVHDDLRKIAQLVAPSGVLLLESTSGVFQAPPKWTTLWTSPEPAVQEVKPENSAAPSELADAGLMPPYVSLLSAPPLPSHELPAVTKTEIDSDMIVIVKDTMGFADRWQQGFDGNSEVKFEEAPTWERVDYFAMQPEDTESENPELHDAPAKLLEWVKQFSLFRSAKDVKATPCLFTVFTSGAVKQVAAPCQTGVWGSVRSMALELAESCKVDFRLVDILNMDDLAYVRSLEPLRERELCVHNGRLWTSRMINNRDPSPVVHVKGSDEIPYRLECPNTSTLADLEFITSPEKPLGPNEILIDVKASALNFRDIMVGLGRLPLQSFERSSLGRTIGMECAGVVVKCGGAITKHKVGDRVLAMMGGCVVNRLQCHEGLAYTLPSNLTFEQGASVGSVYITAFYGLIKLADIDEDSTVLIHSAMGGVGQAAIALCKWKGAKFYGTAGSESKRAALREMGCVDAFDSHSTDWFPDLMNATYGRGVDVVLNSLAGAHVDLSLECLAAGGWHLEIGKMDIYEDRPLKMAVFRKNIKYCAIDMDRLALDNPKLSAKLSRNVIELLECGKLPPIPTTEFPYSDIQGALNCMMNGQHRGKLVLIPPQGDESLPVIDDTPLFGKSKNGEPRTVVLGGCMSGFGLRIFAYAIARGARHIVLLDRDPQRRRTAEWILDVSFINFGMSKEAKETRIEIIHADCSKYSDVLKAFKTIEEMGMPPIGTVFHLAGVIDDKYVADIDRDSFQKVYAPKVNGAWNLHRATLDLETLDHFVMVSSTSSVFGNPGQSNYSAANAYEDGLAEMRKQMGKPATSFCMGAVSEIGMAARNSQLLKMMKMQGMPAISSIFATRCIDAALRGDSFKQPNSIAALATNLAADVGSTDFLRTYAQLVKNNAAFKLGGGNVFSKEAIVDMLSQKLATLCGVESIDPTEPLSTYGLNSISVMEFMAFLKNDMSYAVSAMELMTNATVEAIADGILKANSKSKNEVDTTEAEENPDESAEQENIESIVFDRGNKVKVPSKFALSKADFYLPGSRVMSKIITATPTLRRSNRIIANSTEAIKSLPVEANHDEFQVDLLPPPCKQTYYELAAFVRVQARNHLSPAIPVSQVRTVLLTGATGFVGSHFIVSLLEQTDSPISKVYLPVRAKNDDDAMCRVVKAMERAETWNEVFRDRIIAFAADLSQSEMGLSPEVFSGLCQSVEAVYHFASNLKLVATFQELRDSNCLAMKCIIQLCLTDRRKHLFHCSTLGIFPQYFCQFKNEMGFKPIARDAMPDLALMKRMFPISLAGYVWTKMINELIVYDLAKLCDLPIGVFRFPLMFANSKTGCTVTNDPFVRLMQAQFQVRQAPQSLRTDFLEDGDVCNMTMLRVSLNPDRKNTIYNCSYQCRKPPSECLDFDMVGHKCEFVSYEEFKASCLKLGKESPAYSYWPLIDQFADYWVNYERAIDDYPIDKSTIFEDCRPVPARTSVVALNRGSHEWLERHPEEWPFPVNNYTISITPNAVLLPGRQLCAKYGLDFDACFPPPLLEGIERICAELDVPNPAKPETMFNMTSKIESRVHFHHILKIHPDILDEQITAPVFILGLNRTGTTFLHRMMISSGFFEAPRLEEMGFIPPADAIFNQSPQAVQDKLAFLRDVLESFSGTYEGIHDVDLEAAEEDMCAHSHLFKSLEYDVMFGVPQYRGWLEKQSMVDVYQEHKRWMQFIAWSRKRSGKPVKRWCFKMPWHARSLSELLEVYPDATLIHTHRPVKDVAGSWFSLIERQRLHIYGVSNRGEIAKEQTDVIAQTLQAAMTFRKAHPELQERWLDVQFRDIVESPAATTKLAILHTGQDVDDETERKITDFIDDSIAKRGNVTLHKYDVADYGMSEHDFESGIFAEYGQFAKN